jgi:hypothetical protein
MKDEDINVDSTREARRRWQATASIRAEQLSLLSLSGTMAGLCITGVTLFNTGPAPSGAGTIADDMLALSAGCFLLCTYLIFIALRTRRMALAARLDTLIDTLFTLAMTSMVATGLVMVYTVW